MKPVIGVGLVNVSVLVLAGQLFTSAIAMVYVPALNPFRHQSFGVDILVDLTQPGPTGKGLVPPVIEIQIEPLL
jgi:hypothetical protein